MMKEYTLNEVHTLLSSIVAQVHIKPQIDLIYTIHCFKRKRWLILLPQEASDSNCPVLTLQDTYLVKISALLLYLGSSFYVSTSLH